MKLSPERRDNEARNVVRKISFRPDHEIIQVVQDWCKWPKFSQADLNRLREAGQ